MGRLVSPLRVTEPERKKFTRNSDINSNLFPGNWGWGSDRFPRITVTVPECGRLRTTEIFTHVQFWRLEA